MAVLNHYKREKGTQRDSSHTPKQTSSRATTREMSVILETDFFLVDFVVTSSKRHLEKTRQTLTSRSRAGTITTPASKCYPSISYSRMAEGATTEDNLLMSFTVAAPVCSKTIDPWVNTLPCLSSGEALPL